MWNGVGNGTSPGHWEWLWDDSGHAWVTGNGALVAGCWALGAAPWVGPLAPSPLWPHGPILGVLEGLGQVQPPLTSSLVSSGAARLPWHRYWHRAGLRVPAPWHPCHCQCIPVGSSMSQWVPADPSRLQWVPLGPSRPWCMQMIPVCSKVHSSPSYWGSQ